MRVQVRELLDAGLWDRYCELTGTNIWALNEGLILENDYVDVPEALILPIL